METYSLLTTKTNFTSGASFLNEDEYYDWYEDFFEKLQELIPDDAVLKYKDNLLIFDIYMFTDTKIDIEIKTEEYVIRQLQTDKDMQLRCVEKIREIIHSVNEKLAKEYIAKIPNTDFLYKYERFYIELTPGIESANITFTPVQINEEINDFDIDWEALL